MTPFPRVSVFLQLFLLWSGLTVLAAPSFNPDTPPTSSTPPTEAYQRYSGTFAHQKGPKTVMFVYVRPSDGHAPTMKSHAQLSVELDSSSLEYYRSSYHQTWFGPVVRNFGTGNEFTVPRLEVPPLVNLPGTVSEYRNSFSLLESHTIAAVRALGGEYAQGQRLDPVNFDRMLAFGDPKLISSTGLAFVGGRFSWSGNTLSGGIVTHEWGHNWGVFHANFWQSNDGQPRSANGTHFEYGDGGDVMGGGNVLFNAMFRDRLGFLERSRGEVEQVNSSGTRRVFAYTTAAPRHPGANVRALLLPVTGTGSLQQHKFLSLRHSNGTDGGLNRNDWDRNALQIHAHRTSASGNDNSGTHFLDTTPGSRTGGHTQDRIDGALKIGRTYSEGPNLNGTHIYGGVHITPVARGSVTLDGVVHEYMDVVIHYGQDVPANNAAPSASFAQGLYSVAVNTPLDLTVQANDPDGDVMAFDWDFGDGRYSFDNSASQSITWATPGFYLVSCAVSDMKGGTDIAYTWVNVGNQDFVAPVEETVLAGLNYRYYEGSWSSLPVFAQLQPRATGTTDEVNLSMRQRNDNFGLLFTGFIDVPDTDVYQFRIRHNDGVRLTVSGQTVINAPGEVNSAMENAGNLALEAGRHPIRLEYFHRTGAEVLNLRIWRAGQEEITVPAAWFSQPDWVGNEAPEVALISPVANETFVSNSDILLQATASDDQGIAQVVFFADGAYLGESNVSPYEFLWEKVSVGPRILTAIAYDLSGRWTQSEEVAIVVENPPPANGFGINFGAQNDNTRIQFGERSGAVYRYPNWTQIAGSSGTNNPVIDHNGFATPVRVSHLSDGAGSGFFETLGSIESAEGRMMRGGIHRRFDIEPEINPNPYADVTGIPYSSYDVYVYFDYRNDNADDTIPQRFVLTPSEGPAPAPRLGRNSVSHTNGLGDFPSYDSFNGFREATATEVNAPDVEMLGNYVVFRNQTASAFRIEAARNGAPHWDNNSGRHRRYFNAIQVIERVPQEPGLVIRRSGDALLVSESGLQDVFSVALAYPPTGPVTVSLTPDDQLTVFPESLNFTPENWNLAQAVTVGAVNDSLVEGWHSGLLTLTASGANYSGLNPSFLTVEIQDNDQPQVAVVKTADAAENTPPVEGTFQITRSGVDDFSQPLTVHFSLGGTATPGADYSVSGASVIFDSGTASGSLVIPPGQAQVFLTVIPVDDDLVEGDETVVFQVSPAAAYGIAQGSATMQLLDNDLRNDFAQWFFGGQLKSTFDLQNRKVAFSPDGSASFYRGTIETISSFPSSTQGHTNLVGTATSGGNSVDGFWTVSNYSVPFYGNTYSTFHVGTNGYVTFGSGDTTFSPSLNNHFNRLRVSGYFRDLNPGAQGSVLVGRNAADDRTVITFSEVARWNNNNERVNFQIEFHDDGVLTISWLSCHPNANSPVVGLSRWTTRPDDFVETDFANLSETQGSSDPGNLAIGNVAPVFASEPLLRAAVGSAYSYQAVVTDANHDPLSLAAVSLPGWLSLVEDGPNRTILSGTPATIGTYEIVLRVSDGVLTTDQSFSLVVEPVDLPPAPVFSTVPPTLVNLGETYSASISAIDPSGYDVTMAALQLPGWLTFQDQGNGSATLTGTAPDTDITFFPVSLVATNGLASEALSFNLAVNRPPVISLVSPLSPVMVLADSEGFLRLQTQVTDDGVPADPGTFSLQWTVVEGPNGVLFTAPESASTDVLFATGGEYHLRLTADDGVATSELDLFVSVGGDPNAGLANGLLGYWKFNESSGTTAFDSSGNGLDLTLNGAATFAPGFEGNAYQSTASNTQFAEALQSQPAQFTFSAWVNSTVSPSDHANGRHIFGFRGNNNNRARLFLTDGEGRLRFHSAHGTNGIWVSDFRLPANQWIHVILSYDQSSLANDPLLFINGVASGMTRLVAPSGSINSSDLFRVGGFTNNSNAWKGRIDEARLFNRILSDGERAALPGTSPVNQAPSVVVTLRDPIGPGQNSGVFLGSVSDDGLPEDGQLSLEWTLADGPAPVEIEFPVADETTITFPGNGLYTIRLTASDGELTRFAEIEVTISLEDPEPTRLEVSPESVIVSPTQSVLFSATVFDQFDLPMEGETIQWSVSGGGSIDSNGTFTAGSVDSGPHTVTATSGDLTGTASVTVFNQPPVISAIADQELAINSTSLPIAFTVSDAETEPSALTVNAQSSNATLLPEAGILIDGSGAERTVTLAPAPNQTGQVTVTLVVSDGSKESQSQFELTVLPPIASSINVNPESVQLPAGGTQTFMATVLDQGDQPLDPQPEISWSVSGGGTISSSGTFTATAASGTHTVFAQVGDVQGTATVSILANQAPEIILSSPLTPTISLPAGVGLIVEGSITDDGLPLHSTLSVQWEVDSTPTGGTVLFDQTDAVNTAMRFDESGEYVVRLTADDGELTDEVLLTISYGESGWTDPVNPVLWYPLDGDALDTVGNNDATVTGAVEWVDGVRDEAVRLDLSGGSSSYEFLQTNTTFGLTSSSNFSISVWFRLEEPSGTVGSETRVIAQQMDGGGIGRTWLYVIREGSDHYLTSFIGGSSEKRGNALVHLNTWHHAVMVYQNGTLNLYLDGDANGSWSTSFENNAGALRLGNHKNVSTAQQWIGAFDEFAYFDRALSASEAEALATPGSALAPLVTVTAPGEMVAGEAEAISGAVEASKAVTTEWISPGGTFGEATALNTILSYAAGGEYVLRLTADDGEVKVFAQVAISVSGGETDSYILWASALPEGERDPLYVRDGVPNLLRYAFGGEPVGPLGNGFPLARMDGEGYLVIEIPRQPGDFVEGTVYHARGLQYRPEVSHGTLPPWGAVWGGEDLFRIELSANKVRFIHEPEEQPTSAFGRIRVIME